MQKGRICAEVRGAYRLLAAGLEIEARVSGRFMYGAAVPADYPAVGDWVEFEMTPGGPAIVHAVLPRSSLIVRKAAGTEPVEQILAANVDFLFVVSALDDDFNVRRIERYTALGVSSGVQPILILNKLDACNDFDVRIVQLRAAHVDVPFHAVSALRGEGLGDLRQYLDPGATVALCGSSGAGKSTIANGLLGEAWQRTCETREDDAKGRHTTTTRSLFALPSGAFLIDTPGMRELHLWTSSESISESFADIDEYAAACRFGDCTHTSEPGCRIREALEAGTLDAGRLENYRKLLREQAYLERQTGSWAERSERRKWKNLQRGAREQSRFKRRLQ